MYRMVAIVGALGTQEGVMRFLLVYGTTEGQTRKVSKFCETRLTAAGHEVDMRSSNQQMPDLDIGAYNAVILAGSIHQKTHQESLTNFALAHREQLQACSTLLISVSLSIAFKDGEKEARTYVQGFIDETGLTPTKVAMVAGALRYEEYDYFTSQIVEHVVLEEHSEIEGNHEFTDWDALAKTLDDFAASV